MKIQQEICYLTYQSFPAETANSLQTISNIKYLVKNGADVELIFPLREKKSNESVKEIKKYYLIKEDFKVTGVNHFLPFGRISIFEGFFFHISHFWWSYKSQFSQEEAGQNSADVPQNIHFAPNGLRRCFWTRGKCLP